MAQAEAYRQFEAGEKGSGTFGREAPLALQVCFRAINLHR